MSVAAVEAEIRRRLRNGINAALQSEAFSYKDKLEAFDYPPASIPGEHPHRRTGQLADNVTIVAARPSQRVPQGAVGIEGPTGQGPYAPDHETPGGEYIIPLIGSGRLGPHDSFKDDAEFLRGRFISAATR